MENLETGIPGLPDNEGEKLFYYFDIRQKHPQSKELYKNIGNNHDEFEKVVSESKNPLIGLEGKEILYKGNKIGTVHVTKDLFPQCVYKADGHMDCGFFYQIEIDLDAKDLDMQKAIDLVQEAIGGQKIDYLEIQEQVPDKKPSPHSIGGYSIKSSRIVDPKTLKNNS